MVAPGAGQDDVGGVSQKIPDAVLKRLRERIGSGKQFKRKDLAPLLGRDETGVGKLLTGTNTLSVNQLVAIAKHIGVSLDDLFEIETVERKLLSPREYVDEYARRYNLSTEAAARMIAYESSTIARELAVPPEQERRVGGSVADLGDPHVYAERLSNSNAQRGSKRRREP